MISLNIFDCRFPSNVPNVRYNGSYQMLLTNPNIDIPSFQLYAISYRKSETIPLYSNLVFPILIEWLFRARKFDAPEIAD